MNDDPLAAYLNDVAGGDRAAFGALYSAASAKLFGVCLRILNNRAEAEEALQEVFTRVWINAGRFDADRARAMTWLIAIARNHCIDRVRARRDDILPDDTGDPFARMPDPAPGAEARAMAQSEARRISECFDTLEPARAEAVRGAYLEGLSYADLAKRHAIPLNTVRTWLRRGLLRLKECLES
ncbi:sigma-70 family RNA polymerase sigma factor [Acidimangrovimonas sediminis]|uniref:sigma-70 family RNA polymerase sigma factor n=1 Tax=Acidimangrovimonas sediminis TaxID=2056283 RepID=UPI000C7FBEB4|nr:sigma-70 family RNA polymerase sigma factor [Acidimangrovimonas sediminis]